MQTNQKESRYVFCQSCSFGRTRTRRWGNPLIFCPSQTSFLIYPTRSTLGTEQFQFFNLSYTIYTRGPARSLLFGFDDKSIRAPPRFSKVRGLLGVSRQETPKGDGFAKLSKPALLGFFSEKARRAPPQEGGFAQQKRGKPASLGSL